MDYTAIELDGNALCLLCNDRIQRYINITRLSTHHNIFNSQESNGQKNQKFKITAEWGFTYKSKFSSGSFVRQAKKLSIGNGLTK